MGKLSNYRGWLIKVGDYVIDTKKFIKAESYKVTKNIQDVDSYRDANGILHRNAVDHYCMKVEFETVPMLTDEDMAELFGGINSNYVIAKERKAEVTLFDPENNTYVIQAMYMADPSFSMYGNYRNRIYYNSFRIAFIGY